MVMNLHRATNRDITQFDNVWGQWVQIGLSYTLAIASVGAVAIPWEHQAQKALRTIAPIAGIAAAAHAVKKTRELQVMNPYYQDRAIARRDVGATNTALRAMPYLQPGQQQQPVMQQPMMPMTITGMEQPGMIAPVAESFDWRQVLTAAHVAIVGKTGSGKSALCQWLAANLGATDISVYDSDASPSEWQGLNVIGRGANYQAIAKSMQDDLEELQRRTDRRANGQTDFEPKIIILEESPETLSALKDNDLEIGYRWLKALLRRGRKYGIKLIMLSQGFSVRSLRIEGEGELRDNIAVLRLGNVAIKHGKKTLEESLYQLLKQQSRPLLLDDECIGCVPDLTGFLQSQQVSDRPINLDKPPVQSNQPEPPEQNLLNRLFNLSPSHSEPLEPVTEDWDGTGDIPSSYTAALVQGIRSGLSKNQIITEVLATPKGGSRKYKALSKYHDEMRSRIL